MESQLWPSSCLSPEQFQFETETIWVKAGPCFRLSRLKMSLDEIFSVASKLKTMGCTHQSKGQHELRMGMSGKFSIRKSQAIHWLIIDFQPPAPKERQSSSIFWVMVQHGGPDYLCLAEKKIHNQMKGNQMNLIATNQGIISVCATPTVEPQ